MSIVMGFAGFGAATPSSSVSITGHTSFTKTAGLTNVYTFNYAGSLGIGTFVVLMTTVRTTNTGAQNMTATDSAGNTYTQAVAGTQGNNVTSSSILFCKLTNAVTAATTFTVTGPAGTYSSAQHATVFVVNNLVSGVLDNTNTSTSGTAATTNTATMTSGTGAAFQVVSTGVISAPTFVSVSASWVSQWNLPISGCSQFSASFVANGLSANFSASNTLTTNTTANYAGVMATFR